VTATNGDLAYRARALAQAHPLTGTARRYLSAAVDREKDSFPMPETAHWASATALAGYCVRRVEEADAGIDPGDLASRDHHDEELARRVSQAAADLRGDTPEQLMLGEGPAVLAALEHIVAVDVERRLDHLRDEVDEAAWDELGEFLAWWIVLGYALRVAEVELCTPVP